MANDAIISLRLSTELAGRLRALADERGMKVSAMLREAAERLLNPVVEPAPAPAERLTWLYGSISGTVPLPTSYTTVAGGTGYILQAVPRRPDDPDAVLARQAA